MTNYGSRYWFVSIEWFVRGCWVDVLLEVILSSSLCGTIGFLPTVDCRKYQPTVESFHFLQTDISLSETWVIDADFKLSDYHYHYIRFLYSLPRLCRPQLHPRRVGRGRRLFLSPFFTCLSVYLPVFSFDCNSCVILVMNMLSVYQCFIPVERSSSTDSASSSWGLRKVLERRPLLLDSTYWGER